MSRLNGMLAPPVCKGANAMPIRGGAPNPAVVIVEASFSMGCTVTGDAWRGALFDVALCKTWLLCCEIQDAVPARNKAPCLFY